MYSLLLDSSASTLAVGLGKDHVLFDHVEYEAWQRQSELLVDEIDKMLKKHDLTRIDIDKVIVSKGPGSYTGVRIALSVAKVTAFALNVPLYLVSSLEELKERDMVSICLSNARSKRNYIGIYDGSKCLLEDTIMDNVEVMELIKNHPDYKVCGDTEYLGVESHKVDVLSNLLVLDDEKHLEKNVLAAKPVYLKDSYPV